MLTIRMLIAAGCTLAVATPAAAEVFQIISAGKDGPFVVDCPQSPEGRALSWVAANCRLAAGADAPVEQVIVHGWNPKDKKAIIGKADGDPDRPVVIGTVPNSGNN